MPPCGHAEFPTSDVMDIDDAMPDELTGVLQDIELPHEMNVDRDSHAQTLDSDDTSHAEMTCDDEASEQLRCHQCFQAHKICLTNLKKWNCKVVPNATDENWKPCNCGTPGSGAMHGSKQSVFHDYEDPRRLRFDPSLEYTRNSDGSFSDCRVQNLYRSLQIVNQIHTCCFTGTVVFVGLGFLAI